MPIQNSQLVAAKVSKLEFRGKKGKFPRYFNGLFQLGMWEFDPSQVSQPLVRSATLSKKRENGPEIRAFRAFDFVSRLPLCRSGGGNCRKSPALSANIPVLRRLSAETV